MKATIGTVSSGTRRAEDLIDAFSDELMCLDPDAARRILEDYPEYVDAIHDQDAMDAFCDSEALSWMVDAYFDALNDCAPAYCYFGAWVWDGADYGFWPTLRDLEDDARYGVDVIKVRDLGEIPNSFVGDYAMVVSDYGNVTLYERTPTQHIWSEVWSIV